MSSLISPRLALARGCGLCAMFAWLLGSAGTGWADAFITNCTQATLEDALATGGNISFNCDGMIALTNEITIASDATLDASSHSVIISAVSGSSVTTVTNITATTTNVTSVTNFTTFSRLFNVSRGVSFSIINVTLAGGRSTNGGGIYVQPFAVLALRDCVLSNNVAFSRGGLNGGNGRTNFNAGGDGRNGGSARTVAGGAIYNQGTVIVSDCLFVTNSAMAGKGGNGGNGGSARTIGGDGGRGGNGGSAFGGAIYNKGAFQATNCTFELNQAVAGDAGTGGEGGAAAYAGFMGRGGFGGIGSGAGIFNLRSADIAACTFATNEARSGNGAGGGNSNIRGGNGRAGHSSAGGGICNYGISTLVNCTFDANRVTGGDGGDGGDSHTSAGNGGNGGSGWGGNVFNAKRLSANNCTFVGGGAIGGANGTAGSGGYVGKNGRHGVSHGGNIANGNGRFILKNCLFFNSGTSTNTLSVTNITCVFTNLTRITSSNGEEIVCTTNDTRRSDGFSAIEMDCVTNDITRSNIIDRSGFTCTTNVQSSRAVDLRSNGYGAFTDAGFNLSSDRSIRFKRNSGSRANVDPIIGVLGRNGGTTDTIPLLEGSPAIDAGDPDFCPAVDQRGVARPQPVDGRCDIGAYEAVVAPPTISTQSSSQDVIRGTNLTLSVEAVGSQPLVFQWFFNDEAIADATNSSLAIPDIGYADAGTYSVVVTNGAGSATSDDIRVTVLAPITALDCDGQVCLISCLNEVGINFILQYWDDAAAEWRDIGLPRSDSNPADRELQFEDPQNGDRNARMYRVVGVPQP